MARLLEGIGHTVVHKDAHRFPVVDIDLVLDSPGVIHIVDADIPDKETLLGHNLVGVDVLVEVGIESRAAVHTRAADKAHSVAYAHSCLAVDKEYFPLVVPLVVGMRYI